MGIAYLVGVSRHAQRGDGMDRVSAMLVNLLQAAKPSDGDSAPFFVPIEDIVASLLRGFVPEPEQQPIVEALRSVTSGIQDIGRGYTALNDIAQRIEQPAQRSQLNIRLDTFNSLLDRALSLQGLTSSSMISRAEARIDTVEIFRLIQQISIPLDQQQSAMVVFGMAPRGKESIPVQLGKGSLLDRIEIAYERGSPYPRLNVMTASKSEVLDWSPARMHFQQKDSPDDELSILNARGRDLGRVYTERLRPPIVLDGGRLTLSLPDAPGATFLATTIADTNEKIVARCVRIIPPRDSEV
jgi:hypothetical protein